MSDGPFGDGKQTELFFDGKRIKVFDMVLPKRLEGPLLAPFRAGGLTVEGSFSVEFYPGAIERLDEMIRNHPGYCSICEGFPCQGNHAPGEDA